ncbi:MAG: hypothetical protein F7C36_04440 [Desulfurococcales archaeon]|nr:hypothetical protein [Desulfurococcales archaeon]
MGTGLLEYLWKPLSMLPPKVSYRIVHSSPGRLQKPLSRILASKCPESLEIRILNNTLTNPIGLAAGLNKNGNLTWLGDALCLGFTVVGSILPYRYRGAETKLLLRPTPLSAVNRLGLPSDGFEKVLENISRYRPRYTRLVANIAGLRRNDYKELAEQLGEEFLFVEVNISCPNTEEHGTFEKPEYAEKILIDLPPNERYLLKIPHTTNRDLLANYVDLVKKYGLQGIVAGNTSKIWIRGFQAGLSGRPIFHGTKKMVVALRELLGEDKIIVASGGVFSADDAIELLENGANLIEVLTVLLRRGPRAVLDIVEGVHRYLAKR